MSTIASQQDLFSSLGLSRDPATQKTTNDASELGLNTFLKLMVTQMNNQDPMKPMENGEFLGQIAQFGSVTGLEKLNQQFDNLSSALTSGQALQAGSLVGHRVLVPIDVGRLDAGGTIEGRVGLDESSPEVTLRVYDQVGQLVREMPLGAAEAGPLDFSWDGMTDDGTYATPGLYQVALSAGYGDNSVDLDTHLMADVESVNLGSYGLTLNLQGLGPVAFNNVKQIF